MSSVSRRKAAASNATSSVPQSSAGGRDASQKSKLLKESELTGPQTWSTRKFICVAIGYVITLWIVCYGVTALLVTGLMRATL